MRLLIFVFILNCTQVLGQQYNPFNNSEIIDRKDTFEIKYEKYINGKKRVDTVPLFTEDEINGWRNTQLVTYYFDDDSVRIIEFRDGERGYYFFFFNGADLSKVRISYKQEGKLNTCYYYSSAENHDPRAKTNVSFKNGLVRKDKFALLAAGQTLKAKFYNLQ